MPATSRPCGARRRMLSLDNTFNDDELAAWFERIGDGRAGSASCAS
ncbi:hypothetical protein SVIOM342S_00418 [Streptomyces violaceorubidus]